MIISDITIWGYQKGKTYRHVQRYCAKTFIKTQHFA